MQVEGGKWNVSISTLQVRDDVDFDAQRGQGAGELAGVIPHPALHGREFASDEAEVHLQKSRGRARVVGNAGGLYRTPQENLLYRLCCRRVQVY